MASSCPGPRTTRPPENSIRVASAVAGSDGSGSVPGRGPSAAWRGTENRLGGIVPHHSSLAACARVCTPKHRADSMPAFVQFNQFTRSPCNASGAMDSGMDDDQTCNPPSPRPVSPFIGPAFMLLTAFLSASLSGGIRMATADIHPFEVVFLRNVFGIIVLAPFLLRPGPDSVPHPAAGSAHPALDLECRLHAAVLLGGGDHAPGQGHVADLPFAGIRHAVSPS